MDDPSVSNQYQEPSESDMQDLIKQIPLENNLSQSLDPFVLQMSLQEFWNTFYDDSAPYFIHQYLVDQGDELLEETKWQDPDTLDKELSTIEWDYEMIAYRTFDAKVYVDGHPSADHVISHVSFLLLE